MRKLKCPELGQVSGGRPDAATLPDGLRVVSVCSVSALNFAMRDPIVAQLPNLQKNCPKRTA